MSRETVYFVHISDTHIGPSKMYERHGHHPLSCALRIVELINNLPIRPDFVIHTGDVTTDPEVDAYKLAASVFADLEPPIYYVNGNHDRAHLIRDYLPMGTASMAGADPELLSYTFDTKGYRFLVIDARGPDEIDPMGHVPESQLELIAQQGLEDGPPLTVFVHFPALPLNSIWMDNNMLIDNGKDFHNGLVTLGPRLRAVFHGHVHQPMQTVRDGVLYVSGASVLAQFGAWPDDRSAWLDQEHEPGYGFVHLMPRQTIVHQHTFRRPSWPQD